MNILEKKIKQLIMIMIIVFATFIIFMQNSIAMTVTLIRMNYKYNEQQMYKYSTSGNYFCLNGGRYLNSGNNLSNVGNIYNESNGMKSIVFRNDAAYHSFLWVADNMYLSGYENSGNIKGAMIYNLNKLLNPKGINIDNIDDDSWYVIQQALIWSYTNNDKAVYNGFSSITSPNHDAAYLANCKKIYIALKTMADAHTTYTSKNVGDMQAYLNSLKLAGDININYNTDTITGITLSNYDSNVPCTFGYTLKINNTTIDNSKYKVTNDNGAITIKMNNYDISGDVSSNNIYFAISSTAIATTGSYMNFQNFQPLVSLEKKLVSASCSCKDIVTGNYIDLHLNKNIMDVYEPSTSLDELGQEKTTYITKYNRVSLREDLGSARLDVGIDRTGLDNNTSTTAKYTTTKSLVPVSTGDIVKYAITIYNEGTIGAKATEITDYIPNGLEYINPIDYGIDSKNYGWRVTGKINGQITKVVTTQLANTTISPLTTSTIDSETIYIYCKITSDSTSSVLRNVAEITGDKAATTVDYEDRDSTPGSVDSLIKHNSDLLNWHGSSIPAANMISTKFYEVKGVQDDDDYENVIVKNFDLALTKSIVQIRDESGENIYESNRLISINTDKLKEGNTSDAIYTMKKTPATIKRNYSIIYRITVYNEGSISGYANEITDYLPKGLKLKENSEINNKYGWTCIYDATTGIRTVKTTYLSNANTDNLITSYNISTDTLSSKYVEIECVVDDSANIESGTNLLNYAEISKYGYYKTFATYATAEGYDTIFIDASEVNVDVDSEQPNLFGDTNSLILEKETWIKMFLPGATVSEENSIIENYKTNVNAIDKFITTIAKANSFENNDKNEYSVQDDDDFEQIIVEDVVFDLALRKTITNVTNTNTGKNENYFSRLPTFSSEDASDVLISGNIKYNNRKEAIIVEVGDTITYSLRVFNEGNDYNGYAKQITDYLPAGLKFDSVVSSNWTATSTQQSDGSTKLVLNYNGNTAISAGTINLLCDGSTDSSNYQEVVIKCKVTESGNGKILTNRAEITKDQAVNLNGTNIEFDDRDSTPETLLTGELNLDGYYNDYVLGISDYYIESYIGIEGDGTELSKYQDDTDFENIKVDGSYKLQLSKIDEDTSNGINGVSFKVVSTINGNTSTNTLSTGENGLTDYITENITENYIDTKDIYEISEVTIPDEYLKLKNSIKLYVSKSNDYTYDEDGNVIGNQTIKATGISFDESTETATAATIEAELINGETVTIQAKLENGIITLTIPNKLINGGYSIDIEKVDSTDNDNKIGWASFRAEYLINGATTSSTIQLGPTYPTTGTLLRPFSVKIDGDYLTTNDKITLTELYVLSGNYETLAEPLSFYIVKKLDTSTKKYTVAGINFDNSTSTIIRTSKTLKLTDGTNVSISIKIDSTNQKISITVPNKPVVEIPPTEGKYNIQFKKTDIENSNIVLEGVNFKISMLQNGISGSTSLTTTSTSITPQITSTVKVSTINTQDTYEITEINLGDNTEAYIKLKNSLKVYVSKGLSNNIYNATGIGFSSSESVQSATTTVELENGETVEVTAGIETDSNGVPTITVTIPNKMLSNDIPVHLKKVDSETLNPLSGVKFKIGTKLPIYLTTDSTGITPELDLGIYGDDYLNSKIKCLEISEIDLGDNKYIKLADSFNVYITIGIVDYKYKAVGVSFSNIESSNTTVQKQVLLEDGTYVTINANIENNEVTVTVPNKQIKGEYEIQIAKVDADNSNSPLSEFKFRINKLVNFSVTSSILTTKENGLTNIETIPINGSYLDFFDRIVISEVGLGNENYIGLKDTIKMEIKKEFVNNKYTITGITFDGENYADSITTTATLLNGTKVDVVAKIGTNSETGNPLITVTIPNKQIVGSFILQVKKSDLNDASKIIKGAKFTINGSSSYTSLSDGNVYPKIIEQITKDKYKASHIYSYEIKEDSVSNYIKLANSAKVYVTVGIVNNTYQAVGISFNNEESTSTTANTTAYLDNGTKVTLNASLENNFIEVTIPNEPIEGGYNVQLKKVDSIDNTKTLEGITFDLETYTNGVITTAEYTTDSTGLTSTIVNTIDANYINIKDVYTIKEISLGSNEYIQLADELKLYVTKGILNNNYTATGISFTSSGTAGTSANINATLKDGTTVQVTATLSNGIITITVPNKPLTGSYSLQLEKVDADNISKKLEGVEFNLNIVNYFDAIVNTNLYTNSNGLTDSVSVDIHKTTLLSLDKITITEVDLGDNNYSKLVAPINLYVSKAMNTSTYQYYVSGISFTGRSADSSAEIIATLEDGNIVTLEASLTNNVISIVVPNKESVGQYKLRMKKVDADDTNTVLSGVQFNVRSFNLYGIATLGIFETQNDGLTPQNQYISPINSTNVDYTDAYMIYETSVGDNAYIGLKSGVAIYVNKEYTNNEYKVKSVSFDTSSIQTSKTVYLSDGITQVTINIEISGDTVLLTVPNKKTITPMEGHYDFYIYKYDASTNRAISGVTFRANYIFNLTTKTDGMTAHINCDIDDEVYNQSKVQRFIITEYSLGDNAYYKLVNPISVYVTLGIENESYVVKGVSFEGESSNTTFTSSAITESGDFVRIDAQIDIDGNVKLIIANNPLKGSYGLKVHKIDSETSEGLEGANFKSGVVSATTDEDGYATIQESYPITSSTVSTIDSFTITEVNLGDDRYIKLSDPITLFVEKGLVDGKYQATAISFSEDVIVSTKIVKSLALEESAGNVTVTAEIIDNVIVVTVPNKKMTGNYEFKLKKVDDEDPTKTLAGVTFSIAATTNGVGTTYSKTSNADGYTDPIEVTIDRNKISTQDMFDITEVNVGSNDCYKLLTSVKIYVTKTQTEDGCIVSGVSFYSGMNETSATRTFSLEDNQGSVDITAEIVDGNVIITVPNVTENIEPVPGRYFVRIKKVSDDGSTVVPNAVFNYDRTISDTTTKDLKLTTTSTGFSEYDMVYVEKDDLQYADSFDFTEVAVYNNDLTEVNQGYITVSGGFSLMIAKGLVGNKYTATNMAFTIDGEVGTNISETVKLKDGREATIDAKLEIVNGEAYITITVQNKKVNFDYGFRLEKVSSENTSLGLSGVKFDINGTSYTTDANGMTSVIYNELTYEDYQALDDYIAGENKYMDYVITEVDLGNNQYIPLKKTITIKVVLKVSESMGMYIPYMLLPSASEMVLADGTKANITASYDSETHIVTVKLANKPISGGYNLAIQKVDSTNEEVPVEGVQFTTSVTANGSTNTSTLTTSASGTASFGDVTINKDYLNVKDTIAITEISVGNNVYAKLVDPLYLYVTKSCANYRYDATAISFNQYSIGSASAYRTVELEDGSYVTVNATLETVNGVNNKIVITIPNNTITGEYSLQIKKINYTDNTNAEGVEFTINDVTILTTDSTGISNSFIMQINSENYSMIDTFKITESNADNEYVKLSEPLYLYVTKSISNGLYVASGISFSNSLSASTATSITTYAMLENGEEVPVTATITNNIITVTVPNPEMSGSYNFFVKKVNSKNKNPISGVTFNMDMIVNGISQTKTLGPTTTTGSKGMTITINGDYIDTRDKYTISEVDLGTNKYLTLAEPITIYVSKIILNGQYVVKGISTSDMSSSAKTLTILAKITDGTTVTIEVSVVDKTITVVVPNPPLEGSYELMLEKVDLEDNTKKLAGVNFELINTTNGISYSEELGPTNQSGVTTKLEINIDANYLDVKDQIKISEINLGDNNYIKLKNPLVLYISKGLVESKYQATGLCFEEEGTAESTVSIDVILEDETSITVQASLDNNVVKIVIPNKKITGDYTVAIKKINTKDNSGISGVTFNTDIQTINGITSLEVPTTDVDGKTSIEKINITEDTLNYTDKITIKEINIDTNIYVKLASEINLYITKGIIDNRYQATGISIGDEISTLSSVTLENVKLENGEEVDVVATLENNVVTIVIPNMPMEGKYNFIIEKNDSENSNLKLQGVTFKLNAAVNNKQITKQLGPTDENGNIGVAVTIDGAYINDADHFTFSEINLGNNKYIKLANALDVYVYKSIVEYKYVATGVSFVDNGSKSDSITKKVTLQNGKEVTVQADLVDGNIILTIPNEKITGNYKLQLEKVDNDDETKKLSGVVFKLNTVINGINNSDVELDPTNDDGLTNMIETNIDENTLSQQDTYEITEIDLGNNKYISLNNSVKLYVTKDLVDYKYVASNIAFSSTGNSKSETESDGSVVKAAEIQVSLKDGTITFVKATLKDGIITISVPNKKITGGYELELIKVNSDDNSPISGAKFSYSAIVRGLNSNGNFTTTDTNGKGYIVSESNENNTNVIVENIDDATYMTKDEYQITEVSINDDLYVKLVNAINIYIEKGIVDYKYQVIGVSFNNNGETTTTTETQATLTDGTIVTVKARINTDEETGNQVIVIEIPNKPITGGYDLLLEKVDADDETEKLSGVTFGVNMHINGKDLDEREVGPTGAEGTKGISITTDGNYLSDKDSFTISEIALPNYEECDYIKLADSITLYVTKAVISNSYKATGISFDKDANGLTEASTIAKLQNGKEVIVTAKLENSVITFTIPNKKVDGKYKLQIEKVDNDDTERKLSGVEFKLNTTINGIVEEKNLDKTDTAGLTNTIEVNIPKSGLNQIDKYAISEIDVGNNKYYQLKDILTLEVTKELIDYEYTVTNVKLLKNLEEVADDENSVDKGLTTDAGNDEISTDNENLNSEVNTEATENKSSKVKSLETSIKAILTDGTEVTVVAKAVKTDDGIVITIQVPNKVIDFDLALKKWVSKSIVVENGQTTVNETGYTGDENPEPVTKVDLKNSKINDVTVKFEYKIKVTNEGEYAGEVQEIADHIPDGLRFESSDNPEWTESNGIARTDSLKGIVLEPGESATVTIVLTWINSEKNLGELVNFAEISKDYNEEDVPDKDSTPGNFTGTPAEDDEDSAPVMITVKTGEVQVYTVIAVSAISIIGLGTIFVKKYVIR